MTIEEFKETDWYKERPLVIKQAIDKCNPLILHRNKNTGKQVSIYSFDEPRSGKLEDVTASVVQIGIGGHLAEGGLGVLDANIGVFGVKLDNLEPWD